jgi:hypothetical protein
MLLVASPLHLDVYAHVRDGRLFRSSRDAGSFLVVMGEPLEDFLMQLSHHRCPDLKKFVD